jgi:glycosyltransferase involved in cell wall biosynthesis
VVKVLHVIPAIAPRYGGPSSLIVPLCRALNSLPGVEVELATTNADGPGKEIDRNMIPTDFPVHVFPRVLGERWHYSPQLRKWLATHARDYDLVHSHALWSFASAATARACHAAGVPYVVSPHGMLSSYTWRRRPWKKKAYWYGIERPTVHHASAVHATSAEEAADVCALRPSARTFVIPIGVEPDAFTMPANRTNLRERCPQAVNGRPILLFLSRLHPKKGLVDLLLPALAKTQSNAVLAIAGGEDDRAPGHALEVQQTIARLQLQDRVIQLGAVDSQRRWAMFDGADVFALSSHSENFGIVVAEAMARGCPVVVTDAVESSAHVLAAGAGEVVPRDVAALTSALDRVLANPERRKQYGEAGRDYAQRHFRWEQIALQVEQMYQDCLQTSPSATEKGI